MKNFDALKQMPLKNFANMVFYVVKNECQTQAEFSAFLEKEIQADLEHEVKEALQGLQCSGST